MKESASANIEKRILYPDFKKAIDAVNPECSRFDSLRTVQVNLGNKCNLSCSHCHVEASPSGSLVMGKEVINDVIRFLSKHNGLVLDITGGAPELNPHFRYLIEKTDALGIRRMVRTNLVITDEAGLTDLPEFYRDHSLVLFGSMPCYTKDNVEKQRGRNVFARSINALRRLNSLGYGDSLELNLVYNPGQAVLPGTQISLENDYRRELMNGYGVRFSKLFTITNMPIGRFGKQLACSGELHSYLQTIIAGFNPSAARAIMCRSQISVGSDGTIYNCDFNLVQGLDVKNEQGLPLNIRDADAAALKGKEIVLGDYCFGCTAGEGSSCCGATAAEKKYAI